MPALIIIDMQNDFVQADGAACVTGAEATVPIIAKALTSARALGWAVFHVIREHRADGWDAEPFRQNLFAQGRGICVKGSRGAQIVAELKPCTGEFVVVKTRFSGFYETGLEKLLHACGQKELWLCGTQYPNCLRGTAMDALYRNFSVGLIEDACSAQNNQVAQSNLYDLRAMGVSCLPLAESPLA